VENLQWHIISRCPTISHHMAASTLQIVTRSRREAAHFCLLSQGREQGKFGRSLAQHLAVAVSDILTVTQCSGALNFVSLKMELRRPRGRELGVKPPASG
jgi:hypothetical protein